MIKKLYCKFRENILPIFVLSWFVTLIIAGILLFYPFNIVELHRFEVTSPVVKKGGFVEYDLDFKKNYDIKPNINWYIVDGTRIELVGAGTRRPVGESITTQVKYIPNIPAIPQGTYKLQVDICYPIAKLRPDICYTWVSNSFEVIE